MNQTAAEFFRETFADLKGFQASINGAVCEHEVKAPSYKFLANESKAKDFIEQSFLASDSSIQKFIWEPQYEVIQNWLVNTEGKGLLLIGASGKGKSRLLYSTIPAAFYMKNLIVKPVKAYDITKENFRQLYGRPFIAIDELGREPVSNDYGVKTELLETIIDYVEHTNKTFLATSNIPYPELVTRYGQPCLDRLEKLCHVVVFTGGTLRLKQ